jgi:TatD DNase family protein
MLVDTHCHLDYFTTDADEVVARATAAGVATLVTIGTRVHQAAAATALADRFPHVWATVGVHPHNAGEDAGLPGVDDLVALAGHPKVVGIGESGLDYFYNKSPHEAQQEGFRRHIRAARITGLPLVVHARQADADIAKILQEERAAGGDFAFVLHCFSSGRQLAELAVEIGGYVSLSGILTFPKSDDLRAIAADLPAERLLVETDAPYLAPVPHRGKRCEPAMVVHAAEVLARVRGWSVAQAQRITTENALRLFGRLRVPTAE